VILDEMITGGALVTVENVRMVKCVAGAKPAAAVVRLSPYAAGSAVPMIVSRSATPQRHE